MIITLKRGLLDRIPLFTCTRPVCTTNQYAERVVSLRIQPIDRRWAAYDSGLFRRRLVSRVSYSPDLIGFNVAHFSLGYTGKATVEGDVGGRCGEPFSRMPSIIYWSSLGHGSYRVWLVVWLNVSSGIRPSAAKLYVVGRRI